MLVRPRLAHLVAAGITAPLLTIAVATAAAAHGAPTDPVSRSAACGSQGRFTQNAACRAARAGAGGAWFEQWDNVRVANVNGRDRETIPDGKLCSGGIANFGGLDLGRSDWPTTQVQAGKTVTVSYRATIPHQGSFRMYVTKSGYDPKQPLRWADLEAKPFLTVKDPAFVSGSYTFKATLPSDTVGRQVLYTIWQNSSTADTYYSCSDVIFTASAKVSATSKPAAVVKAKPAKSAKPAGKSSTSKPKPSVTAKASPSGTPSATAAVSLGAAEKLSNQTVASSTNSYLLPAIAGAGLLALAGGGGMVAARRGRRTGRRRH
ncbi:MAG TPA: lytic polysaccharide monooxygenase [Kineosporiaceae bacterium]|nr:lytic polysaccharide monooxygenase [Kineosporiaceae bacterium]